MDPRPLDRDTELAELASALGDAAESAGRLVAVEGPAGIGKTRLLDAACAEAAARGMTVLRARGSDLESRFPFGVALQLCEPPLRRLDVGDRDEVLAGAAGLARPLLDGGHDWGPGAGADFALLHGLHWVVANLGERAPVMLAVDDAQWADEPSLRFVHYLVQRIDELPVTVVLARRTGEATPSGPLLDGLAAHPRARRLSPAPLTDAAIAAMVEDELGAPDPSFVRACARLTGGNPYLLHELLTEARDAGVGPRDAEAGRLEGLVPRGVLHSLAERLAKLPEDATRIGQAAAILGDDARLHHVAALAGLETPDAAAAVDALIASDVLEPGGTLRFRHPLVAAALYAQVPAAERGVRHLRVAELLRADGAPPERLAAHLVQSPASGDAGVVDVLRTATARALALGAPEAAAAYVRRALEEPPAPGARPELLVLLGRAAAVAGDPDAPERLCAAARDLPPGRARADVLREAGRVLHAQGEYTRARAVLGDALDELGDADEVMRSQIVAEEALASVLDPAAQDRVRRVVDGAFVDRDRPMTVAERTLLATVALHATIAATAPRDEVLALADRALGGRALLEEETSDGTALYAVTGVYSAADRLEANERLLTDAVADGRRRGSVIGFANAIYARAWPRLYTGRLADAAADAERAIDAGRYGWRLFLPAAYGVLMETLVECDELDAAQARAAEAIDAAGTPDGPAWLPFLIARGRLAARRGEADAALEDFEACGRLAPEIRNPAIFASWRGHAAVLHARHGDPARAAALVGEEVATARAFGAPRALGAALRAQAAVDGGAGQSHAVELLEEALAVLEGGEATLERCGVLVELGVARRRAGRRKAAGQALGAALDLARSLGARAIERRAVDELERSGSVARRAGETGPAALSPSERRVADLAAAGLSNREIAEELFVTRKAVEFHLRNVYLKLGIASRKELPEALGE